jgi:hypothetical protein
MKIPIQVWKKVRKIQRDFLWGEQKWEEKNLLDEMGGGL